MTGSVRAAFFTDSFHDVNGVAHTSRQLEAFARRRGLPILSAHTGPKTYEETAENECHVVEFGRSRSRIPLDDGLAFDPWFLRFWHRAVSAIDRFRPTVMHVTGPGDVGLLGALLAWRKRIPLVASWHTNLHEYAAQRFPVAVSRPWIEKRSLDALLLFYGHARVCLAPNEELRSLIETRTRRPSYLMERGIDTDAFSPAHRRRDDDAIVLGYVGRLRPEKNVRLLARVEQALIDAGITRYRFLVVGDGSQREWLRANLKRAEFPGVLRGEALSRAYASMDLFVFPSWTDTYGNVVVEALASGVPALVTTGGGPKFLVQEGRTGGVADTEEQFARRAVELLRDPSRLEPMRVAAREWALGRSWDSVFEKVWKCYELAAGFSMASCSKPFVTAF